MAIALPNPPLPSSWPHNLQQKQLLEFSRGDVFALEHDEYAVVGFDGRIDGYICWARGTDGRFDTSRYVTVERTRLPHIRLAARGRAALPLMPELDHTGRIAGGSRTPRSCRPSPVTTPACSPCKAVAFGISPPRVPTPCQSPLRPPLSVGDRTPTLGGNELVSFGSPAPRGGMMMSDVLEGGEGSDFTEDDRDAVSDAIGRSTSRLVTLYAHTDGCGNPANELLRELQLAQPPQKKCFVINVFHIFHSSIVGVFSLFTTRWLRMNWRSASASIPGRALEDCPRGAPSGRFDGLRVALPILKPLDWELVLPLVEGKALTFDERGWKETMTVRPGRWSDFVDRQQSRLERELREMRRRPRTPSPRRADATVDAAVAPPSPGHLGGEAEEDVAELELMVERLRDWKDLARYSGRSVSMATTQRGTEMALHVFVFEQRDDRSGVDFMRLSLKKTVELLPAAGHPGAGDGPMLQLLRRPDMAKFIVALAFRSALARDGVDVELCDAPLAHAGVR